MARIGIDELDNIERKSENSVKIKYFTLKNDGDEAIVRFVYDSPKDFEIYRVHPYTDNGRTRYVNCQRNWDEDYKLCPMCADGEEVRTKFYVKLIKYENVDGKIVATPMIWERSLMYAKKLKLLAEEYGTPMIDNVFKIKRCGAPGSKDTTYEIMYGSPRVYADDRYVKDAKAFKGFNVLGTIIKDKRPQTVEVSKAEETLTDSTAVSEETNTTQRPVRRY